MAGTYDNEQQRIADRIKCVAFREARDAGATFIVRSGLLLTGGRKRTTNALLIIRSVVVSSNYRRIVKTSFSMRVASRKKAHPLWQGKLQRDKMSMLREAQSITTDIGWD